MLARGKLELSSSPPVTVMEVKYVMRMMCWYANIGTLTQICWYADVGMLAQISAPLLKSTSNATGFSPFLLLSCAPRI